MTEKFEAYLESDRIEVDLINRLRTERNDARNELSVLKTNYETLIATGLIVLKDNETLRAENAMLRNRQKRGPIDSPSVIEAMKGGDFQ